MTAAPPTASGSAARPRAVLARLISTPTVAALYVASAIVVLAFSVSRRIPVDRGLQTDPPFRQRDFRDTVFLPVRDLLSGNNPYDVVGYLARNPQAQEFNLYAPGHLLLVLPIGVLPLPVAAAAWTALLLIAVPLLVSWSATWTGVSVGGTTVFGISTMLLASPVVLLSLSLGQVSLLLSLAVVVALAGPPGTWWTAAAATVAMVKPQFAIPLIVALVLCGRWKVALRGSLGMVVLSVPVLVACAVAAGGPGRLIGVLLDNLAYSRQAPTTAADSVTSTRVDVAGTLARLGSTPPAAVEAGLILGSLLIAAFAVWLAAGAAGRQVDTDRARLLAVAVAGLFALGLPFSVYDLPVAVPALIATVAMLIAASRTGRRTPGRVVVIAGLTAAVAVPFLHVRTIERALSLDGPLMLAADCAGLAAATLLATGLLARRAWAPPTAAPPTAAPPRTAPPRTAPPRTEE